MKQVFKFGTIDDSVHIFVNRILGSPDHVVWSDDKIEFDLVGRFKVSLGLSKMGGGASYWTEGGSTEIHQGLPFYDLSKAMHQDLSFAVQLCLDALTMFEERMVSAFLAEDSEFSELLWRAMLPMILFLELALADWPELINDQFTGLAKSHLHSLGWSKGKPTKI